MCCVINVYRRKQVLQWPFGVPGILAQRDSAQHAKDEQHDHYRLKKKLVIVIVK